MTVKITKEGTRHIVYDEDRVGQGDTLEQAIEQYAQACQESLSLSHHVVGSACPIEFCRSCQEEDENDKE